MTVVSDTSPVNYLVLIGQIDLLPRLFGQISIPPAVMNELRHPGTPEMVRQWVASAPSWLQLRAPAVVSSDIRLGRGEAEAISLACELNAAEILLDDMQARKAAIVRGLKVAGTLLLLDRAARQGWINMPEVLESLMQTNFRASAVLIRHLLKVHRLS